MMYYVKQYATYPPLTATLYQADGSLLSLEDATAVYFTMRPKSKVAKQDAIRGTCTIIDVDGVKKVRYTWAAGDTDNPGVYVAEFLVVRPSGNQIVPNRSYNEIEILTALDEMPPVE